MLPAVEPTFSVCETEELLVPLFRRNYGNYFSHHLAISTFTEGWRQMSMPIGRSEKRTPIQMPVMLTHLSEGSSTEKTFTENVSSHGARAITRRRWEPGARLLVSFAGEDIPQQARVVYCQHVSSKRFVVGLALRAKGQKSDG